MLSFQMKKMKAFSDSGEVLLKPITILVGKNSCGKSSLLRFPAVLSQTAKIGVKEPPIALFGDEIDYGNFEDVVYGKNGNTISFSISYMIDIRCKTDARLVNALSRSRRVSIKKEMGAVYKKVSADVTLRRVGKNIKVSRFAVRIGEDLLSELRWVDTSKSYILNIYL